MSEGEASPRQEEKEIPCGEEAPSNENAAEPSPETNTTQESKAIYDWQQYTEEERSKQFEYKKCDLVFRSFGENNEVCVGYFCKKSV